MTFSDIEYKEYMYGFSLEKKNNPSTLKVYIPSLTPDVDTDKAKDININKTSEVFINSTKPRVDNATKVNYFNLPVSHNLFKYEDILQNGYSISITHTDINIGDRVLILFVDCNPNNGLIISLAK